MSGARGASGEKSSSFDHLVGTQQNRRRHRKAERLGGLGVQNHLESGRKLNRQVGRLCATKNAIDIESRAAKHVHKVGCVGKQTAVSGKDSMKIDSRYIVSGCQQYDWRAMDAHKNTP